MADKPLKWMGSSKRDLLEMPEEVVDVFGFALSEAQQGRTHPDAKPMSKGVLKGKSVFEVVDDFDGDTYRCVYTVKLANSIYVLHSFQKKSKTGIETAKSDISLIESRYQDALRDASADASGADK